MSEPPRAIPPPTVIQIVAGFAIQLAAFGAVYTFGAVLDPVRADLGVSRGAVALLPAVAAATLFAVGPFTGRLADRRGTAFVVRLGAGLLGAGLLVTSVAPTLPLALVGFGIVTGGAVGCLYVPVVASIAGRAGINGPVLTGVVVAGVGIGTASVAPALSAMADAWGWRWAYRVYGPVAALVVLVASLAFSAASRSAASGARTAGFAASVGTLARRGEFRRLYAALLLVSPSVYIGLVFLASYARSESITASRAAVLLSIFGLASTAGRLALTALGRRRGADWVFRQCFVAMAASLVLWALLGGSYPLLVLYALVAGLGYGGIIGLGPTVTALRFGSEGLATTLGVLYTSLAVGGLLTGPLAGLAVDAVGYRVTLLALAALTVVASALLPHPSGRTSQPCRPGRRAPLR